MSGKLHHISVTCRDIEKSRGFYSLLGFISQKKYEDGQCTILWLGGMAGIIELFNFKTIAPEYCRPKKVTTTGITHIALMTTDLAAIRQCLEQHGYACEQNRTARIGAFDYFFTADPDGNLVEIIEEH
ncbi:VOC family protein [Pantoea sp. B65]|uniref:VOC family protein n=1 Tax=Pantoea sp. B65 TaxID=2813359 RepID=UPI0039B5E113